MWTAIPIDTAMKKNCFENHEKQPIKYFIWQAFFMFIPKVQPHG